MIALGAGYHHERYDGRGYPRGLSGDEIPEIAQMIAVADTFDAMYSTRPYRKQMPLDAVVAEIKRVSGTQLSPRVVDVFLRLVEQGAFDRPETESAPADPNAVPQTDGQPRSEDAPQSDEKPKSEESPKLGGKPSEPQKTE